MGGAVGDRPKTRHRLAYTGDMVSSHGLLRLKSFWFIRIAGWSSCDSDCLAFAAWSALRSCTWSTTKIINFASNCNQCMLGTSTGCVEFVDCEILQCACGGENKLRGRARRRVVKIVSKHILNVSCDNFETSAQGLCERTLGQLHQTEDFLAGYH